MEPKDIPLSAEMSKVFDSSLNAQIALKLVRLGFPVFPCNSGRLDPKRVKAPLVANGFYSATLDVPQLSYWWSKWPDALVGIPTGGTSGISVLDGDVDKKTGENIGEQQIVSLGLSHSRALVVNTPSGGIHYYFRHVDGVRSSTGKIASHIDVRGDGGYTIAPENVLPDGRKYQYEKITLYEAIIDASLPNFPVRTVKELAQPAPSPTPTPSRPDLANNGMEQTRATEAETLRFLSEALKLAPNDLDREDWVKLAASLKVEFDETLRDEFLDYSLRYVKGDCTTKEATHVWNSAIPHTVTSVAPALSLLKSRMAEDAWKVLWKNIFSQRDAENVPQIKTSEINATPAKEVRENQIDPVDLWDKFAPPELPRGLLPKIIEEFAVLNGKQMGADPAGLAMGAVVTCAAAIPDQVRLKVKQHDDWFESARIWSALVGPPSTKKSPIIDRATAALSKLDVKMMATWLESIRKFDALDVEEKKGKQRPKQTRLRLEDTTVEAAQQVLEGSPWGILMLQDELSGFFGAMDKYNGGKGAQADRAFWLRSYNGGNYAVNRVSRGAAIIHNVSVSMLGGIQPEPIRKIAGDAIDDGLLQRLFPILLDTASIGVDEPMPPINQDYEKLIGWLRKLIPHGIAQDGYWSFSADAQLIRRELEAQHLSLQTLENINRKLASHIGKYDGLFARLCLIWHFVEYFDPTSTKCSKSAIPIEISGATAKRVAGFLHEFLLPHALAFYSGVLSLSDEHDRLQSLAGYILARHLEVVKNRHVQRGDRQMRGLKDHEIRVIFEQLEALGWLKRVDPPKPSSPPHWHVNPVVHIKFEARANQERKRRQETQKVIQEIVRKDRL